MPTKNVEINVRANTGQSEKAFKKIEDSATKTAVAIDNMGENMSMIPVEADKAGASLVKMQSLMQRAGNTNLAFNRVLQDSPYFFSSFNMGVMAVSNNIPILFESFQRLRVETGSTKTALKAFLGSFTGPQGFLSIISLAVSAGTALSFYFANQSREAKKAKEDIDKVTSSIQSFIKVVTPLDDKQAQFRVEQIPGFISKEKKVLDDLQNKLARSQTEMYANLQRQGLLGVGASLPFGQKAEQKKAIEESYAASEKGLKTEIDLRQKTIGLLEDELNKYKALQTVAKYYSDYVVDKDGKLTKAMGGRSRADYKSGSGSLLGIDSTFEEFNKNLQKELFKVNRTVQESLPVLNESQLREKFRTFDVIANESARTLFQVFSQAWDDIFGKANSVFGMLLQNISMGLLDLFAQDVSSSIFNALIPGGGGISGGIGSFLGLSKQGTTLVQIGDTQLQEATTTVIPKSVSALKRKRVNL